MNLLKSIGLFVGFCMIATIFGCSPEVGSDKWCQAMKDKPKRDWTATDAKDYAKHCILK